MAVNILQNIIAKIKYGTKPLQVGKNPKIFSKAVFEFNMGGKIQIGDNCLIRDYAILSTYGGQIIIGNNFGIESFSILYGAGGLKIGNNVIIAAHTVIIPSSHNFSDVNVPIREQGVTMKGIVIEDDVWIGTGCKILDGVTIGKGSVIGAGSVVRSSLPPYSVAVGVPAKIIKTRK